MPVLEAMDGAVLGFEKGAAIGDVAQCGAGQPADADCGSYGVGGVINRPGFVEVAACKIEAWVAKDWIRYSRAGQQLRPEDRNALQVSPPMQLRLQLPQKGADIVNEASEGAVLVLRLSRVHLVPQIPGEDHSAAAPTPRGEGQPCLQRLPCGRADKETRPGGAGTTICGVVRMLAPAYPSEEGVEGCEQDSQANLLAKSEQVVPELDHGGHEVPDWPFQETVVALRIFQHQPEAGDAVVSQISQMPLHAWQVTATKKTFQLRPGDRVVLPDRGPRITLGRHEIGGISSAFDPR